VRGWSCLSCPWWADEKVYGLAFVQGRGAYLDRKLASNRRIAIASAVYSPCFKAFLFPFGAPGDVPPCIRQRPFFIAGDRQDFPLLVFAPQRGLE
jgi:hypothetical protein